MLRYKQLVICKNEKQKKKKKKPALFRAFIQNVSLDEGLAKKWSEEFQELRLIWRPQQDPHFRIIRPTSRRKFTEKLTSGRVSSGRKSLLRRPSIPFCVVPIAWRKLHQERISLSTLLRSRRYHALVHHTRERRMIQKPSMYVFFPSSEGN
jgi:hypothetical protein